MLIIKSECLCVVGVVFVSIEPAGTIELLIMLNVIIVKGCADFSGFHDVGYCAISFSQELLPTIHFKN